MAAIPGTDEFALRVGDRDRTGIVVHAGELARAGGAAVIVLHGSNQSARKVQAFAGRGFDEWAHRGAVVAYLDGYQGAWNDARLSTDFAATREGVDDVGFAAAAIEHLVDRYAIDRTRVFVVGFSNGGQLLFRLLHETPELIAGAAAIGATQPTADNFRAYDAPPVPVPLVLFHGTKDPLVPYGGGMASLWGLRPRGMGRSAPETAEYYAQRNGIRSAPETTVVSGADAGLAVDRTDHREEGRAPVALYTVHGGGHTIPGAPRAPLIMGATARRLIAADVIAEFFGFPDAAGASDAAGAQGGA